MTMSKQICLQMCIILCRNKTQDTVTNPCPLRMHETSSMAKAVLCKGIGGWHTVHRIDKWAQIFQLILTVFEVASAETALSAATAHRPLMSSASLQNWHKPCLKIWGSWLWKVVSASICVSRLSAAVCIAVLLPIELGRHPVDPSDQALSVNGLNSCQAFLHVFSLSCHTKWLQVFHFVWKQLRLWDISNNGISWAQGT